MGSFTAFLTVASVLTLTWAQSIGVGFTSVPAVVQVGQTYNITWGGGDGTPVTLTLRQGDRYNLSTIDIIANSVSDDYFLWTPSSDLPTARDYALQISQGLDDVNYSGQFALVGGTGTVSISYSGASSTTRSSNATMTSMTITQGTAASVGTGTALLRNTTFSSQSLTAPSSTTASSTTTSPMSSSSTASSSPTNAATQVGSSAAFVMGLVGAIMFLQ